MRHIYIVGAQCTGKTTLVDAISVWLSHNRPDISFTTIGETARTMLQLHHFTRDDVRAGGVRCAHLQQLILQCQIEAEDKCEGLDMMISDRSGIDPMVYAQMYCGADAVHAMQQSNGWARLESSMKTGTVILCEPVEPWLYDDGIRLVPESREEWLNTHRTFCAMLQQHQIPYTMLAASMVRLDERVQFVLDRVGLVDGPI